MSKTPYSIAVAVLTLLQLWGVMTQLSAEAYSLALAWFLVPQVLKAVVAIPRLNDLGRPPELAMLGLLPLVSIGLFRELQEASPGDEARARRLARVQEMPTALGSLGWGITAALFRPTVVVVCGLSVALSVGVAAAAEVLAGFAEALREDPTVAASASATGVSIFQGASAVLGLYFVVQIAKARRASRLSWLPVAFLLPSLLLWWGANTIADPQAAPLTPTLIIMAVDMLGSTVVDGLAAFVWVWIAAGALGVERPAFTVSRLLGVVAMHACAWTAILLGANVVVPGLYYLLQFALLTPAAVLEPDVGPFSRSSDLTRGRRDQLFALFVPVLLFCTVVPNVLVVALHGWELPVQSMTAPQLIPWTTYAYGAVFTNMAWAIAFFALTHYYVSISRYEARRDEARAKTRDDEANVPSNPFRPPVGPEGDVFKRS